MSKKWNVMIVPSSPGMKIRNFDLSSHLIWRAAIAVVSLIVIVLVGVLFAGHQWQKNKLEQISHLEGELEARNAEFSRLNREFSALEELEDKLRTIAGLKPRNRSEVDVAAGGQGGPDWGSLESDSPGVPADGVLRERTQKRTTQRLYSESLKLKDSFEEVLDVFERESDRLSRIPSINPIHLQEAWISSGFGYRKDPISGKRRFHEGCDIVAPRRTSVIAPADGVVTFAGWRNGLGRTIEIEHGYGYITLYGHNDKLFVKKGDAVTRGDLIAHVGSSGRSTGPHLHYEVHHNGKLVNPYKYLVQ